MSISPRSTQIALNFVYEGGALRHHFLPLRLIDEQKVYIYKYKNEKSEESNYYKHS